MAATGAVTVRVACVHMRCVACGITWSAGRDAACAIGSAHLAATVVAVTMSDGDTWVCTAVPQAVTVWPL